MKWMLDTNICIGIIKGINTRVLKKLHACAIGDVCISSITMSELCFGVEKSTQQARNRAALDEFLLPLEVAPYDESAAYIYGIVRSKLESKGTPIGSLDMLIGAHALALGTVLVTNNTSEFKQIKGLQVVDWL